MKLSCPACGAVASLEAWTNDKACRQSLALVIGLPKIVQVRLIPYLALFRNGAKGLAWPRVERLLTELTGIIKTDTLSWDGKEPRRMNAELWASALDAVLKRNPTAMGNHNYLRHTAYEMADPTKKYMVPAPIPYNDEERPRTPQSVLDMSKPMSEEERRKNREAVRSIREKLERKSDPVIPQGPEKKSSAALRLEANLAELGKNIGKGALQPPSKRQEHETDKQRQVIADRDLETEKQRQIRLLNGK
jgi:hypothetical protein